MLDWALPPSQSATLGERHHGVGAVLPATKVTKEIEAARGVPKGEKCFSPAAHKVFHNPRELVRFIATMRERFQAVRRPVVNQVQTNHVIAAASQPAAGAYLAAPATL